MWMVFLWEALQKMTARSLLGRLVWNVAISACEGVLTFSSSLRPISYACIDILQHVLGDGVAGASTESSGRFRLGDRGAAG